MVSRTDLHSGRIAQKNRTRKELLAAAWELLRQGLQPTVDEVAAAADISRATAYRYFPNRERLLIEAVLNRDPVDPAQVIGADRAESAADRMARVVAFSHEQIGKNETLYRSLIRAGVEEWLENRERLMLRTDQRLELIEEALAPIRDRVSDKALQNLTAALAAMAGIESYIALRDVCQLSKPQAKAIMSWAVRTLVDAVASGVGGGNE